MDVENEERLICMMRFEDNKLPEVYLIPAHTRKTPWIGYTKLYRKDEVMVYF